MQVRRPGFKGVPSLVAQRRLGIIAPGEEDYPPGRSLSA